MKLLLLLLIICSYIVNSQYIGTLCGIYSTKLSNNITCGNTNNNCPDNYYMTLLYDDIYTCVNLYSDTIMKGTLCGLYPNYVCGNAMNCDNGYEQVNVLGINTCVASYNNDIIYNGILCGFNNKIKCNYIYPNDKCPNGYYQGYINNIDTICILKNSP